MEISHYSILLLVNSPELRSQFCHYLSQDIRSIYDVIEIGTATEALTYLVQNQPDLILLDAQLPDISALELLQEWKCQFHNWHIPVIILVEESNETLAIKLIESGAAEYLIKEHLSCLRFCQTVYSTLEKNSLRQQLQMYEQQQQANEIIRQQTFQALHDNQILLQGIMDSLPMAILWRDLNSRYLGCNRQVLADAGLSSVEEIIGKTDFDLPWREQASLYQSEDRIVIKTGKARFNIEEPVTTGDNRTIWVRTNKIPLHNLNGEIFGVLTCYEDITERKEIEQALQESERRYATLAASVPVGIFRTDVEGNCVYVNDRWCENTGLTPQQAAVYGWKAALHPEDKQMVEEQWHHVVQTGQIFNLEYRFLRADGLETWVFGQAVPEKNSDGTIIGYAGTITNISSRKQAEEALHRSQQLYRILVDNFPNGAVILFDHDLRYLLVGGLGLARAGLSKAEMEGKTIWEIFSAEVSEMLAPLHQRALAGEMVIAEIPYHNEFYLTNYLPVRDEQDKVIAGILVSQNITERRKAEQERDCLLQMLEQQNQTLEAQVTQRTAELQQSKERFRNLVETSSDWVWEVDQFGIYTYASPQIINLLGYTPDEVLGITPFDLMPPEEAQRVMAEFTKFSSVQAPFQCLENTNRHKDGRLITLETSAVPIFDANQQFCGYRGIDRDITSRKQAELVLRQANERLAFSNQELARATRLKDEFLATMSHELRTPLNAILGMAEGLQDEVFGLINDHQRRSLQTIERSGQHLLELINDILDLSKIEAGQMELHYSQTAISSLCQASLAFIQQQAVQKHIQVEMKIQPNLPDLLLDERRIRQVLINLLNNAVKFTPEGGQITLEVSHEIIAPEQNVIHIAVIDTGIGIAGENLQKIFQPFIQIDSALNRQYVGTGLGLALVKRIVELHNGKVNVSSELGVGSCFSIDLPYANIFESSPELVNYPLTELTSSGNETLEYAPLILLAEDNEDNIFTLSTYLTAIGYRLILAKNGQEAIALADAQNPDLILMDIQMPGMDGLEAIKQIRLERNLSMPIIALTALVMPGDREKCLAIGANSYLSKPIKLKQLATTIQDFLITEKLKKQKVM
ncbi:PAS domain S-box protein [Nostoc sp. FACHB-110]|uniref:PAS domain S-box protein n=1 Tax=Nostoc sp. FACHB-110 TaxID=2692834 RepID=UPI001686A88E|nr:PAS domain S-box protein [Nostoc sp. FACHB-110]MBD2435725.1 PAS domain S-box protein [Nostoc sp. FACHB-110]